MVIRAFVCALGVAIVCACLPAGAALRATFTDPMVLPNGGDSGESDQGAPIGGAVPRGVPATGDIDQDGRTDVMVANVQGNVGPVSLYRNTGSGFTQTEVGPVGRRATSVTLADVEGRDTAAPDGRLDIVYVDGNAPEIDVLVGQGDGTFATSPLVLATGGAVPQRVVAPPGLRRATFAYTNSALFGQASPTPAPSSRQCLECGGHQPDRQRRRDGDVAAMAECETEEFQGRSRRGWSPAGVEGVVASQASRFAKKRLQLSGRRHAHT
jgi:FG-GAP-like repeat